MAVSVSYISLDQEAALALQGAQCRLAKAKRELEDFVAEHGAVIGSPDERQRERHALEIEADDAARQVTKAAEDLNYSRTARSASAMNVRKVRQTDVRPFHNAGNR